MALHSGIKQEILLNFARMPDLDTVSRHVLRIRKELSKLKEYVKKLFMRHDGPSVSLEYSHTDRPLNKHMMRQWGVSRRAY